MNRWDWFSLKQYFKIIFILNDVLGYDSLFEVKGYFGKRLPLVIQSINHKVIKVCLVTYTISYSLGKFVSYWKCNFPMCQSVCQPVGQMVSPTYFLKGQEVTIPCSNRSTCFLLNAIMIIIMFKKTLPKLVQNISQTIGLISML